MDSLQQKVYGFDMPKIKIQRASNTGAQDTFDKVCQLFNDDKDLHKLDPGYVCDFDTSQLKGTAKGKQFQAEMSVAEASTGASVEIVIELPMHLGLVKGMVQKTLEKKLDKALG